jgi:hypothetical protein
VLDQIPVVADCPECRGVRTVFFGVCEVCFSEFDEWRERAHASLDA